MISLKRLSCLFKGVFLSNILDNSILAYFLYYIVNINI